ncbi:hypothetical protein [Acetatifactor aquisgranensis]|uniref:hypothetical protein n=1 Tax=Acetatifactor aquisgranensis TaxID=2941233 RepID=UPI00204180D8|nr:hypothetical protein [Acetatifactor aquisgranensis]
MGKTDTAYMTYRRRPLGYRLKKYRLLLPLVLSDPEMFKLLRNTLTISIARLVVTFFPPILLTIVIFDLRSTVFKKISQTFVYIPHFFSWVIIYGIVFAFFSESGFVNALIGKLGGNTYPFMTSSKAFVPLLVGSQVWKEADDMDEGEKAEKEKINEGVKAMAGYDRWPNDGLLSSVSTSTIAPNLGEYEIQQLCKFVIGERSMDEWDDYVQEWLDRGGRDILTAQAEKLGVELPAEAQ